MDNIRQLDERAGASRRPHPEVGQRDDQDTTRRPATPLGKSLGRLAVLAVTRNLPFGSRLSRLVEAQNLQLSLFWSIEALASVSLPGFDIAIIDAELWPMAQSRILKNPLNRLLAVALISSAVDGDAMSSRQNIAAIESVSRISGIPIVNMPASASPSEVLERLGKLAHHQDTQERREPETLPSSL